jgi:hypothetical protein
MKLNNKQQQIIDEIINWFYSEYEGPEENCCRLDQGWIFLNGPHKPEDVIKEKYSHIPKKLLTIAIQTIENSRGFEWVKKE